MQGVEEPGAQSPGAWGEPDGRRPEERLERLFGQGQAVESVLRTRRIRMVCNQGQERVS